MCPIKLYKDFKSEKCEVCPNGADCVNGIIYNLDGFFLFF